MWSVSPGRRSPRNSVRLLGACLLALLVAACGPESSEGTGSNPPPGVIGTSGSGTTGLAGTGGGPIPAGSPGNIAGSSPAAGSGGSAGLGPDQLPQPTASPLPCEVAKVVSAKCGACHGAEPIGGAPMSLMSQSDFSKQLKSIKTIPGSTVEVAKLVKQRINDSGQPMPPGELLPENERALFNAWLDQGMPVGAASDVSCLQTTKPPVNEPVKNPDGTTCYKLQNHGQPVSGDTSPYPVNPGEHYVSFYYTAPWKEPSELVRWRTIYDNQKVMHHWLLYSTLGNTMDGTFLPSIGTHIGDAAQLVAGWAVGGNDVSMPPDVGLRLPAPGAGLMLEWHFFNNELQAQMDSSAIEICVVPAGTLEHTAGMTWLGTENFNGPAGMPPKVMSDFAGTCRPSRLGMNATDPIKIFTFWPHMHTYGRHMKSVVTRANGVVESVFDKPFDFNFQITHPATVDLYPGDTITSTCTFLNTSDLPVAFGPSTNQEMCYQFAFSYPAGALDNGVPSLVGATNTCW